MYSKGDTGTKGLKTKGLMTKGLKTKGLTTKGNLKFYTINIGLKVHKNLHHGKLLSEAKVFCHLISLNNEYLIHTVYATMVQIYI